MKLSEIIEILDSYSNEYLHEGNMIKNKAFENIAKDLYKEFQAEKKAIAEKAFCKGWEDYQPLQSPKEYFEDWHKYEMRE